jgi:restriction system protein
MVPGARFRRVSAYSFPRSRFAYPDPHVPGCKKVSLSSGESTSARFHILKNEHSVCISAIVNPPCTHLCLIVASSLANSSQSFPLEPAGPDPYFHWRPVKWIGEAIPRANFSQDLLYSFGAFMTICRIQRNNAESRILAMRASGWKAETISPTQVTSTSDGVEAPSDTDLEQLAQDQIAQLIAAWFAGHGLTRLVDAVLRALGYTTYQSGRGNGGADILAGSGDFEFGTPRLCVQVKSDANPTDRPTVDKLLGAITKFGAQEGLFVSWSGFKGTVQKELAPSFFRVRLWSRNELLAQLFTSYDRLDEDIKAELPLKRIWTVAVQEDE